MSFERPLRLGLPTERAIGQRERVVSGAEIRGERDGALEVTDGDRMSTLRCCNATEAELRGRFRGRLPHQCLEQTAAFVEVARVEERFGKLDPTRKVIGLARKHFFELADGIRRTGETLQDDGVQVVHLERGRRKRLRANVRVMRSSPLFPRVKRSSERTDRLLVARSRGRVVIGARNGRSRHSCSLLCWR